MDVCCTLDWCLPFWEQPVHTGKFKNFVLAIGYTHQYCEYQFALQENSYQAVLLTDGTQSYTVLTYKCGELNWGTSSTSIGFSAGPSLYANHPLSRRSNVRSIACLNSPESSWSNVVYKVDLSKGKLNQIILELAKCMMTHVLLKQIECVSLDASYSPGLRIVFNSTKPGSIANYSCDVGYNLIGQSSRTCLSNGVWSGLPPFCQSMQFT